MKKKNIFIGFNKDKERCLLYKIDENSFVDLETNTKYTVDDLLETTILPYNRFISLKGFASKKKAKKKYQKDANERIRVDELYIGDLGEVTSVYGFKESLTKVNLEPYMQFMCAYCNIPMINEDWYMPKIIDYKYSYKIIAKDILLQRVDNENKDSDYICLISNTKISHKDGMLEKGDIIVGTNLKPFKEVIEVEEKLMPKNKVMELHIRNRTK